MEEIISKMENFLDNVPLGNHQGNLDRKREGVKIEDKRSKEKPGQVKEVKKA